MVLKRKDVMITVPRKVIHNEVLLKKEGEMFNIYVNDKLYVSKTNELFAVQVFNAI